MLFGELEWPKALRLVVLAVSAGLAQSLCVILMVGRAGQSLPA